MLGALVGCQGSGSSGAPSAASSASPGGAAAPAPAAEQKAAPVKMVEKDLSATKLPFTLMAPENTTVAEPQLKVNKDAAIAQIRNDDGFGIQVWESPFEWSAEKKRLQAQQMIPFKKWVKEEPDLLFYEGKGITDDTVYAFEVMKKIDGKEYSCESIGMGGKDMKVMEQMIESCRSLKKKK
jgi:hypothetical protein